MTGVVGRLVSWERSYDDGMAKEHEDAMAKRSRSGGHGGGGGRAGGSGTGGSGSKVIGEVASALKNYGATAGEAREAAEEASKSGGSFDDVFKRALDMVRHKQNPKSETGFDMRETVIVTMGRTSRRLRLM